MKRLIVLMMFPWSLWAQDQVIINHIDRSIIINNKYTYEYVNVDSNYNYYNHKDWGGENRRDTFLFVRTEVVRKKNVTVVTSALHGTIYKLNKQLKGKSYEERDSMLNSTLQEKYRWRPSNRYRSVSHKVTSVQYYENKYPYVDIYKTYYELYDSKKWYTSKAIRVFILDEILYLIYLYNFDSKTDISISQSRKAVYCDFQRLVNNIKIIEAEDTPSSK